MPIRLDIVTPERLAYSDDVDEVVCPGIEGELGILPHHAPLLTTLGFGSARAPTRNPSPSRAASCRSGPTAWW